MMVYIRIIYIYAIINKFVHRVFVSVYSAAAAAVVALLEADYIAYKLHITISIIIIINIIIIVIMHHMRFGIGVCIDYIIYSYSS